MEMKSSCVMSGSGLWFITACSFVCPIVAQLRSLFATDWTAETKLTSLQDPRRRNTDVRPDFTVLQVYPFSFQAPMGESSVIVATERRAQERFSTGELSQDGSNCCSRATS